MAVTKPIHPLTAADGIMLTTKKGEQVLLTSKKLESWLAAVEKMDLVKSPTDKERNDPYMATQFVSRFGFKTPNDLIVFLKSPAGESTKAMIGEELAEIAAMKEEIAFQIREDVALRNRRIA